MPMVVVGVLLLLGWWLDVGPLGRLPWYVPLIPFVIAALWWEFADSSGWTQRKAIEKMEKRKADRRQNALEALGLDSKRERQVTAAREDAARRNSPPADPTMRDYGAEPPKRDPRL